MAADPLKPVRWIGSSLTDLKSFPEQVRSDVGFALYAAQNGEMDPSAKPMKGFVGAGVMEIVASFFGDTWRAIYSVRFQGVIYVLHAFQKKSKSGRATPKKELELIRQRLSVAEKDYKGRRKQNENQT